MNISIYVNPQDLAYFIEVSMVLNELPIINTYSFNTGDIEWTESFNSEFVHCSLELSLYRNWRAAVNRNSK